MTKRNERIRTIIVDSISAVFILLFVYAALSKIQDFQKFKVDLGKSPVLGSFKESLAIMVPLIELIIALMFTVKRFQILALHASFNLMVMFSTYIIIILNFVSYVPCSCGGVLQNMTWNQHLIFNVSFVFLAVFAILIYPIKKLPEGKRESQRPLNRWQLNK